VKENRIRFSKCAPPSATTLKIIGELLRAADPDRLGDPDVDETMLVMMRVQRRTIREVTGEKP